MAQVLFFFMYREPYSKNRTLMPLSDHFHYFVLFSATSAEL